MCAYASPYAILMLSVRIITLYWITYNYTFKKFSLTNLCEFIHWNTKHHNELPVVKTIKNLVFTHGRYFVLGIKKIIS